MMKTFVCKVCSHVAFDQAPVDCPVCRAPIENFDNNPEAIRLPENPQALSEIEKKHIPVITVSRQCRFIHSGACVDIHVNIGELEHAIESEHSITFIDFYIDHRYLARIQMRYKRLYPAAGLHVSVDRGTLTVVANCNVDGKWMSEINLSDAG